MVQDKVQDKVELRNPPNTFSHKVKLWTGARSLNDQCQKITPGHCQGERVFTVAHSF